MCQYQNEFNIAGEDLVVYKIMKRREGKLYSFFLNFEYEVGKTYFDRHKIKDEVVAKNPPSAIDRDFYHAFLNRKAAEWYLQDLKENPVCFKSHTLNSSLALVKCTIPAGTKYFLGEVPSFNNVSIPTVAAKKIKINEIIDYVPNR